MNNQQRIQFSFFLILLGISAVLTFIVYRPFINVIVLALVLAILLNPVYEYLLKKFFNGKPSVPALIIIILTFIFILVPVALISVEIFNQSRDVYFQIQRGQVNYLQNIVDTVEKPIQSYYPDFSVNANNLFGQVVGWIGGNAAKIISGTTNALFGLLLVVISLFFFLKDGKNFLNYIIKLSPLDDVYDVKIFQRIGTMLSSVVRGVLFIAVIQAILVGVGFYIFGVPNATLWGTVTVLASVLPLVGTSLVVLPGVLYLLFTGKLLMAVGLFLWGALLVGLIDNLLMPFLYGKGNQVHPLIILFAVLGGIYAFGPLGFLIGPMIISFFVAILEIYREQLMPKSSANL